MLRYDKRTGKIMLVIACCGLAVLIVLALACSGGEPGWEIFLPVGGFMAVWFGVLIFIFFIPFIFMNNKCKKVEELGYDVYGVIVRARRNGYFSDGKRGMTYIYGFDIAVYDGRKTKILTLSFREKPEDFDVKKCYGFIKDLTKSDNKKVQDFNSVFDTGSPLFIKGKKYKSDVLFKQSISFGDVPLDVREELYNYCNMNL